MYGLDQVVFVTVRRVRIYFVGPNLFHVQWAASGVQLLLQCCHFCYVQYVCAVI